MKKIFLLFILFGLLQNDCFAQPMPPPELHTIRIIDDTSVELCWPVVTLNGNTFNEFQFYYSDSPTGPYNLIQTLAVPATSITITGLPVVTTSRYFYAVTLFNTNQLSVSSDTIQSILLNVSQGADRHMLLSWNPIYNPAYGFTEPNYRIYRKILPATVYTQISNIVPTTSFIDSSVWHHLPNLLPFCNDSIYYRVEIGDNIPACLSISNQSGILFKDEATEHPPILNKITVTSILPLQDVTFSWEISTSLDVEGYKIYKLGLGGSPIEVADVPGRLINSLTLTALDFAFPDSLSETYRIAAYDSCGNTSAPTAFHNTIFVQSELDACNGIINLNWNTYKNWPTGVANYEIYVSQNGSGFTLLATVGPTDTTFAHFPLIQATLYTYKIKALDVSGFLDSESNFVETIADVPVRPAFLYFKYATVFNNRTVDLMIYHDTTADIKEYKIFRSDNLGDTFDSIVTIPFSAASEFISYRDTVKCLTFKKSYVYRAIAYDLCGQPVFNSSNVAKTIFLKAATELDMENTVSWSDYENWYGEVRSYKVFRGFQGVFSDIPAATIPFGENTFTDDISNRVSKDGEYCYYVQAYQGLDTLNFFADSSRSNKVCIKQLKTFYIPNAFQPDGINKTFKPGSTFLNANNYTFQIFNKWGERVFETIEPDTGWDGTINGREARMDVYVYRITYQNEDFETQELRGTVTLVR